MNEIIAVFRMEEISKKQRAKVIIKLGRCLNDQMAMNWTEGIVYELVSILDPDNQILSDDFYLNKI